MLNIKVILKLLVQLTANLTKLLRKVLPINLKYLLTLFL